MELRWGSPPTSFHVETQRVSGSIVGRTLKSHLADWFELKKRQEHGWTLEEI